MTTFTPRIVLSLTNAEGRPFEQRVLVSDRALKMSGWTLRSVSASISRLTAVESLRLDDNDFAAIPSGVAAMVQLRELNMSYNVIAVLPSELCRNLTNLTELNLRRNKIAVVPREIACLSKLKVLMLQYNEIEWLPVEIDRLPRLCRIHLHENPLIRSDPDENSYQDMRPVLGDIFAATTRLASIAGCAATICIGLQDLELPALVTLEIVDAAFPNDIAMHRKWKLVTAVKHFHRQPQG